MVDGIFIAAIYISDGISLVSVGAGSVFDG